MMYVVYILKTSKNTLYIGQTNNLERRLLEHKSKKTGAKYMKYFADFQLVYTEAHPTRSAAMKREWELKQLTRKQKDLLINGC